MHTKHRLLLPVLGSKYSLAMKGNDGKEVLQWSKKKVSDGKIGESFT